MSETTDLPEAARADVPPRVASASEQWLRQLLDEQSAPTEGI